MFLAIDVTKLNTLLQKEITSDPNKNNAYNGSQIKTLLTTLQTAPYPNGAAVQGLLNGLPGAEKTTFARLVKFVREFYPGVDEDVSGRVTYRGFKFRTNGDALLSRAKDAWTLMGKLTTTMQRYLTHVKDPSLLGFGGTRGAQSSEEDKAIKLYIQWFDKTQKMLRINEVKRIVGNLQKAVNSEDFQIICEGDPNDQNGLCYPNPIAPGEFGEVRASDNLNRFYLGPVFFNALPQNIGGTCSLSVTPKAGQTWEQAKAAIFTALNASTVTMLHELTHITAIGSTDDVKPDPYNVARCKNRAANYPDIAIKNAENYALFAKDILNAIQFNPPEMKR
jgi:hypothetical protein